MQTRTTRSGRFRWMTAMAGAWLAGSVLAAPPQLIRYQARLTDGAGVPFGGSHNLQFEVFDADTGGTAQWSEGPRSVTLADGVVDILLGEVTPLPSSVFTASGRWLEVTVNGAVLSPRQRLTSTPFSHAADRLGTMTLPEVLDASVTGLDEGYDKTAPGGGRIITADAGAVWVAGPDGLHVSGSVGIGTTSPSTELHVVGSATLTGGVTFYGCGTYAVAALCPVGNTTGPACDTVPAGSFCAAAGECGLSQTLDNCGTFDWYFKLSE